MEKTLHIAIGIPSLDMWHADFAMSLIGLVTDLKQVPVPGFDGVRVSIINQRSSAIPQLRQQITEEAQKIEANYILWVDSDQMFPKDTARRLIAHDKDVIGCNIAVKRLPSLPTARKYVEQWPLTGDIVYTKPESTGIEKVWKLGCGVMLVKMSVFDRLKKPYFNFGWNETTGFVGEDWFFCSQLWDNNIELYIDHDLSKEIGHIGVYSHRMEDVDHTETLIKIVRPDDKT